jgi:hypothetical protein
VEVDKERAAIINVGGMDYALILTTRATKQIGARYGGLEQIGEKLMKSENFALALEEIVWLLCLLANQSIMIHNLRNPQDQRELLTEEMLELLTSPLELATHKEAITAAMFRGTKRNVESEPAEGKNAQAG